MPTGRMVTFCHCGTQESWNKMKRSYHGMNHIIPATVYVSDNGICLVTSQEWADWLTGKTDEIPTKTEGTVEMNEKRTISIKPSCFSSEFDMIVSVPEDRDAEEYIDELLDGILNEDLRYNVEWDFIDGIS